MKPSLRITSMALLATVFLFSCKKDETRAIVQAGTPATLNASASTLVLTKATENNTAMTFTFTPASFGYKAAITYTLQFAKP